jgi:hypothetical protein
MKKSIKIEVGDAASTAKGFIDAWHRAEIGEGGKTEHLLMFENLETLLKTLTPGRWVWRAYGLWPNGWVGIIRMSIRT